MGLRRRNRREDVAGAEAAASGSRATAPSTLSTAWAGLPGITYGRGRHAKVPPASDIMGYLVNEIPAATELPDGDC
jgi:hypothetical protein